MLANFNELKQCCTEEWANNVNPAGQRVPSNVTFDNNEEDGKIIEQQYCLITLK